MGRRSVLTPELQGDIVKTLEAGATANLAAAHNHISAATFHSWTAKGRAESARREMGEEPDESQQKYVDFLEAVTEAQAKPVLRVLALIQKAAEKDWRAGAWYAEHVTPELALKVHHYVHQDEDEPSVAELAEVPEETAAEVAQLIHQGTKGNVIEIGEARGNGSKGNGKASTA